MTLDEMKDLKCKLEINIYNLISEFEDKTNIRIADINLYYVAKEISGKEIKAVDIEVEL